MLIRHQLILRFLGLVFAIQLCLTAFVYFYSARSRELRFYHRLEARANHMANLLIHRLRLDPDLLRTFRQSDLLVMPNERVSIYDASRRLRFRIQQDRAVGPVPDARYFDQITARQPARFRVGEVETLGILTEHHGQPYWLFVAGQDRFGRAEFASLRPILVVGNAGALALIILAAWYFAVRSLRPLGRMVQEVENIRAPGLHQRVDEGNGRDEIARLAITFNRMLDGLQQAFEAQKSFFAHASHELRTPLANLLGTLETASAYDTTVPAAKSSIDSAIEETHSIIDLTNGLLALAKAEDTSFPRTQVALDECVVLALAACATKYPGRDVQLQVGTWPESAEDLFAVCGNAALLTTVVGNLLDNACKYSAGAVAVGLRYASPTTIALEVRDSGIGMAPADVQRVREPLYRAANGQAAPGYGLGLAIADKIIQLHGGRLLIESELRQGTAATVQLPAAPSGA